MSDKQPPEELRRIAGDLGQPLPKIGKADRVLLKTFLKRPEALEIEPSWRLRLALAAGLSLTGQKLSVSEIARAIKNRDVVRFLDRLCNYESVLDATAPLKVLSSDVGREPVRPVLAAFSRLAKGGTVRRGRSPGTLTTAFRIDAESASLLLKNSLSIARAILRDSEAGVPKKRRKKTEADIRMIVDVAFLTTSSCEEAEVVVIALELIEVLDRRIGMTNLERIMGTASYKCSEMLLLPTRLIPRILSKCCLRDAEVLASRCESSDEARSKFHAAVVGLLTSKGVELPAASREWAERFLGYERPSEMQTTRVDSESDVNLERMATVLLAAWEARNEGDRSLHSFEVLNGICKSGFRLTLGGEQGDSVAFDPSLHELARGRVASGEKVTLLRPWVQWSDGPVQRIIVRALVKPFD